MARSEDFGDIPIYQEKSAEIENNQHLFDDSQRPAPKTIEFTPDDPTNPLNFSTSKKWLITAIVSTSVLAVTLTSSAYSSSAKDIITEFNTSDEIFALGISLFVLGFAVGPALWAPLSELYGRRILFITTHAFVVAFVAGCAGCHNMASLLVFRFLAGTFGASPMTNSGGVISDLFPSAKRGVPMALFSAAPFMGPMLGPIMGGFITANVGWRWTQGVCCIFLGVVWILGSVLVPETYGPVLLHNKAQALTEQTGHPHISVLHSSGLKPSMVFGRALKRPWVLLFKEPIVMIASIYMAILYGIIYMFFGAFPIVYQEMRGWGAGIGGLAFLGLTVGMLLGLLYAILDRDRYRKMGGSPEARLPLGIVGAILLPVGMFAFAWTNSPSIHWSVSIILSAPFGVGCVFVFLSCLNYLLDAYTIYAASVLAASAMLRSFFATAFPLFVTQMYHNLGVHWASSVPAFLTVACVPFPILGYKYGAALRMKCKYAREAAVLFARMQGGGSSGPDNEAGSATAVESVEESSV